MIVPPKKKKFVYMHMLNLKNPEALWVWISKNEFNLSYVRTRVRFLCTRYLGKNKIPIRYPAVVAWIVRASGNNTSHLAIGGSYPAWAMHGTGR